MEGLTCNTKSLFKITKHCLHILGYCILEVVWGIKPMGNNGWYIFAPEFYWFRNDCIQCSFESRKDEPEVHKMLDVVEKECKTDEIAIRNYFNILYKFEKGEQRNE